MAREPKQPVSIDGIEFDALIEQSIDYTADVPEYPTEKGFCVSDNISLKQDSITMTLYVTDTPVTWRNRFGTKGFGRVEEVVKKIEQLFYAKKVFTVVTSDAVYENMVLSSFSISKTADAGYAREIPVTLKKIIITGSKTVKIPDSYGKSGATGASAGAANTTTSSSSSDSSKAEKDNSSILYSVSKSAGLI